MLNKIDHKKIQEIFSTAPFLWQSGSSWHLRSKVHVK